MKRRSISRKLSQRINHGIKIWHHGVASISQRKNNENENDQWHRNRKAISGNNNISGENIVAIKRRNNGVISAKA